LVAEGDFVIEAEQGKIERLIQNLLENASQYGSVREISISNSGKRTT